MGVIMRDVYNFRVVEAYNEKKFEGIIDINANIGDEISIKNPSYDKIKNPEVPARLYYYPIKVGLVNYLLSSNDINKLPIKIIHTTKVTIGTRAYQRIDDAVSIKIKAQKMSSYKDYINNYMNYNHIVPKEWIVWKIITERAVADKIFVRAISYPSWGKTSSFYVKSLLRNDIEILDNNSYAKLKYSLSAKPKVLVVDEVDDITTETKRSLSKVFRNCADGRGNITNDTRASSGVSEKFELEDTSIVALYNFPKKDTDGFFEKNFHPKIISRLFPILLNGGNHDESPMLYKHKKERKVITDEEKEILDNTLKNSRYYEENWFEELDSAGKIEWKSQHEFKDTRWQQTYQTMCNGLKLYADTEDEYHELEDVLFTMNTNYLKYVKQYAMGDYLWDCGIKDKETGQIKLQ